MSEKWGVLYLSLQKVGGTRIPRTRHIRRPWLTHTYTVYTNLLNVTHKALSEEWYSPTNSLHLHTSNHNVCTTVYHCREYNVENIPSGEIKIYIYT